MARDTFVDTATGSLDPDLKLALKRIFTYVLNNLRFGQPVSDDRAENFQAYFYDAVTPATPGQEFSIVHNLGVAPYLLIPVLATQDVNAQLVPLTVTRAADANRVYLSSSVASTAIKVLIEG